MLKSFAMLLITCTMTVTAAAQNQDALPLPACDITDVKSVYSQAMKQNVTLKTHLTGEANSLPSAALSLTLADGTKIDLGSGRKYIDDFTADSIPSCKEHLRVATAATLGGLTATPENNPYNYVTRYNEFTALIALGQDCQFPAGEPKRNYRDLSPLCKRAVNFLTAYNESDPPHKSWPEGRREALLAMDAPIIYVQGSTYFVTINLYDPIDNILREIMYEGC